MERAGISRPGSGDEIGSTATGLHPRGRTRPDLCRFPALLRPPQTRCAGDYFRHERYHFQNRGEWQRSESSIRNQAEVAWISSPLALQEVLRRTIDGTYDVPFIKTPEERAQALQPILDQLAALPYQRDEKFITLCKCLREFHERGRRIVVFTESSICTSIYGYKTN